MFHSQRESRRSALRLEPLESRNLLSVLINAKPTLHVELTPPHVTHGHKGVYILQPAVINVTGTAQPPAPNASVTINFFAEDTQGNLVNGGLPVGSATPDSLGIYHAQVTLPSTLRKDVNQLVAVETAVGFLDSNLNINATTLSGLTGGLNLNGMSLTGLNSSLVINGTTVTGLAGSIANPASSSTVNANLTGLGGSIANPLSTGVLTGTVPPGLAGTITTPASTSTLSGGTGTIAGTSASLANTSLFTQTGSAAVTGTTGTSTQTGTAAISGTSGTFSQTGTAAIAATTGTSRLNVTEEAVSDPVAIFIHQPRVPFAPIVPIGAAGHAQHAHAASTAHPVDHAHKVR